jgi:sugar/nucleoside kinase (ribokinase family)
MSVLVVGNAAHLDLILQGGDRPSDSGFGLLSPTPGSAGHWNEGGATMTIALAVKRAGTSAAVWHPLPRTEDSSIGLGLLRSEGVGLDLCPLYRGEAVRSIIIYGIDHAAPWRLGFSMPPEQAAFDAHHPGLASITHLVIAPVWGHWTDAALDWAREAGLPKTLVGFADDRAADQEWERIIVDEAQATELLALGTKAAEWVITDGPRGARILACGAETQVTAVPASVIDQTGAGDTFAGAYLGARLAGASVTEAGSAAARMAARVCETWGSRPDAGFMTART